MKSFLSILFISFVLTSLSQPADNLVYDGNKAFHEGNFATAIDYYQKAIQNNHENAIAKFNLANAFLKDKKTEAALRYFSEVAQTARKSEIRAKAFYNKGVVEARQRQLAEAIESFKKSLLLQPDDDDAKENLQKAINELKKQQQNRQENHSDKPKPNPRENKNKENPAASLMEQKFNELRDKEKQLQKTLQQKPRMEQPEKDW